MSAQCAASGTCLAAVQGVLMVDPSMAHQSHLPSLPRMTRTNVVLLRCCSDYAVVIPMLAMLHCIAIYCWTAMSKNHRRRKIRHHFLADGTAMHSGSVCHLTLRSFCWAATGSSGTSVIGTSLQGPSRWVIYCRHNVVYLSVCLSVTKFIVAKWHILQQKCPNKWIGNIPRNTILFFSTPTLTLCCQTHHPPNLEILYIYHISLAWLRDSFVYVAMDVGV